jgi:hypothetical protein
MQGIVGRASPALCMSTEQEAPLTMSLAYVLDNCTDPSDLVGPIFGKAMAALHHMQALMGILLWICRENHTYGTKVSKALVIRMPQSHQNRGRGIQERGKAARGCVAP